MHRLLLFVTLVAVFDGYFSQDAEDVCGYPPPVEHATVTAPRSPPYPVGTLVTYKCDFGYVPISGSRTSECLLTRDHDQTLWTQPQIVCNPRSCGDPGFIENGRRMGSLFTFPNNVTFECEEGFTLRGSGLRFCQASGTWSGRLPTCEKLSCPTPKNPENGLVTYSSLEYGSELKYQCNKGFKLTRYRARFCSDDGTWSGEDPVCIEVQCDLPISPRNGAVRILGGQPRVGSIAVYNCHGDLKLKGVSSSKCLEGGIWTFPPPECVEHCRIPEVSNGKIIKYRETTYYSRNRLFDSIPEGRKVEDREELFLLCDSGYSALGRNKIEERVTCEDGKWEEEPWCEQKPCIVPSVSSGRIGKYQRDPYDDRKKVLIGVPVGERMKDGEELILQCNNGYEINNTTSEKTIKCTGSSWPEIPRCEPASCRSEPPETINGVMRRVNRKHLGTVYYTCEDYARKMKHGNVTCYYGTWIGITPTCKDLRCNTEELNFPGLVKVEKRYYNPGENFFPSCENGYVLKKRSIKLHCNNGNWNDIAAPCEEGASARCTEEPPIPEHGRVKDYDGRHNSTVLYECDPLYFLEATSHVKCISGKWEGRPPPCKDSRCYTTNLKFTENEIPESGKVINSGDQLDIHCISGYSPRMKTRLCSYGKWLVDEKSPCSESSCSVYRIDRGALTERNISSDNEIIYTEVPLNEIRPARYQLYVSCDPRYAADPKVSNVVPVTCKKGKWTPVPACFTGTSEHRETNVLVAGIAVVPKIEDKEPLQPTTATILSATVSVSRVETFEDFSAEESSDVGLNSEVCVYQNVNPNVVAYIGEELLQYGSKVKRNGKVRFHCKNVGYLRLVGPTEIACNGGRKWEVSQYPKCVNPSPGEPVVYFNSSIRVLPGGAVGIDKGANLRMACSVSTSYPSWGAPNPGIVHTEYAAWLDDRNQAVYASYLDIVQASSEHKGWYQCTVGQEPPLILDLLITEPVVRCADIEDDGKLIIQYELDKLENSSVSFSCKKLSKKLVGPPRLTCLSDGRWSGEPPKCTTITCPILNKTEGMLITYSSEQAIGSTATYYCNHPRKLHGKSSVKCLPSGKWSDLSPTCNFITCPKLDESEDMKITYSDELNVGSTATFECPAPRHIMGNTQLKCDRSGKWSDSPPSCALPPCSLESLPFILPKGVVPDKEVMMKDSLPYGSVLRLSCECGKTMKISGPAEAKCGKDGKWEVPKVHCIRGCGPITKSPDSQLIIEPEKDFYKLGDFVTFACPPEQKLTLQVERVMCLPEGWAGLEVPECKNMTMI